jgi:hypothetical protein
LNLILLNRQRAKRATEIAITKQLARLQEEQRQAENEKLRVREEFMN